MRKIYIAGNWKMNKSFQDADDFFYQLSEYLQDNNASNTVSLICPPSLYIELGTDAAENSPLSIGAQNISEHSNGAHTGEISAEMLSSMDVEYCLVGHSERRQYHSETNQIVNDKIKKLQQFFIKPVLCLGESLQQRESGATMQIIKTQLQEGLADIDIDENLIIAYEPVWAIGTGKTASPQQAQEVHALIRKWIAEHYNANIAQNLPILYGGSVKPANLKELLDQPDIDGGLIGGASLDIDSYIKMLDIASNK